MHTHIMREASLTLRQQINAPPFSQQHKFSNAHAHTHARTHIHALAHTRAREHANTHTHAHARCDMHARTHTHTHKGKQELSLVAQLEPVRGRWSLGLSSNCQVNTDEPLKTFVNCNPAKRHKSRMPAMHKALISAK